MRKATPVAAVGDVIDVDEFEEEDDDEKASSEPSATTDDQICQQAMNYAWHYFEYHALQRVHLFRFFLLTSLAVIVGYYHTFSLALAADKSGYYLWPLLVAFIGHYIATSFRRLDARSVELITNVEGPLKYLEDRMQKRLDIPGVAILTKSTTSRRTGLSFRSLIPQMIATFQLMAAVALLVSAYCWSAMIDWSVVVRTLSALAVIVAGWLHGLGLA